MQLLLFILQILVGGWQVPPAETGRSGRLSCGCSARSWNRFAPSLSTLFPLSFERILLPACCVSPRHGHAQRPKGRRPLSSRDRLREVEGYRRA